MCFHVSSSKYDISYVSICSSLLYFMAFLKLFAYIKAYALCLHNSHTGIIIYADRVGIISMY